MASSIIFILALSLLPRLHITYNYKQICPSEGCENETWNICRHYVKCYPEHGRCSITRYWTVEEKCEKSIARNSKRNL